MTVDFGKVEKYIEGRGFGFVSHTFAKVPPKEVFLHIKIVKRTHPELAQALDSTTAKQIYFWYEYRTSSKGQEVVAILNAQQVHNEYTDEVAAFIATIKTNWINIEEHLSEAFRKATLDLLTSDEANQLAERRETLKAEKRRCQEELRKAEAARFKEIAVQRAAQQEVESAKHKAIVDQIAAQKRTEEEEFRQLVIEMSAMKFKCSSKVSEYIVRNRLGYKYKHISGILQMELNGNVWDFDGGFPPNIYARLCRALGLRNKGSRAVPGKFTPYKNIFEH